jgi:hypothetical protein
VATVVATVVAVVVFWLCGAALAGKNIPAYHEGKTNIETTTKAAATAIHSTKFNFLIGDFKLLIQSQFYYNRRKEQTALQYNYVEKSF